jgi:hypothetical protein
VAGGPHVGLQTVAPSRNSADHYVGSCWSWLIKLIWLVTKLKEPGFISNDPVRKSREYRDREGKDGGDVHPMNEWEIARGVGKARLGVRMLTAGS